MVARGAGSASLSDDPAGALDRLSEATGVAFRNLSAARQRTEAMLALCERSFRDVELDRDASVVLMGSWGRRELTRGSDDDYMVLLNGPVRVEPRPTLDEASAVIGGGSAKPGLEGVFGEHVYAADLTERIGLDRDDNRNLTRRMLLLLESIPVAGGEAYRQAWTLVLNGYLRDPSVRDFRPPRFLLNDLVRYWRTICVDFVGKERQRAGEGWGLSNAKLRTSRKVLFASGLLPILQCHEHTAEGMSPFLAAQFRRPRAIGSPPRS